MEFALKPDFSRTNVKAQDTVHSAAVKAIRRDESRCPIHLGVIMTKRKKFGLGRKIFHLVCPLCTRCHLAKPLTKKSKSELSKSLELLTTQYAEVASDNRFNCKEITRLQSELQNLKEDLVEQKDNAILETDILDRLLKKALPKIEELVEASQPEALPSPVDQVIGLRENMSYMETRIQQVEGKAQQVVAEALEDVLFQLDALASSNREQELRTKQEREAYRNEVDELQVDLANVKRTMKLLPAEIKWNEESIRKLRRKFTALEERMDQKHKEYDSKFADQKVFNEDMLARVSSLETSLQDASVSSNGTVHFQRKKDPPTPPTFSKKAIDTRECTIKFLEIARDIPLAELHGKSAAHIQELRQLAGYENDSLVSVFLNAISESPREGGDGLERIFSELRAHVEDATISTFCMVVLMALIVDIPSLNSPYCERCQMTANTIVESHGGVGLLLECLKKNPNNDRLHYFGFNVLAVLAFHRKSFAKSIIAAGGMAYTMSTLRDRLQSSTKSIPVNDAGTGFLFCVGLKSPNIRKALVANGGMELARALNGQVEDTGTLEFLVNMMENPTFWWGSVAKFALFVAKDS